MVMVTVVARGEGVFKVRVIVRVMIRLGLGLGS